MESFFTAKSTWERLDGSLHVYVLPDEEVTDRLAELQGRIEGIDDLPAMPRAWFHFTVNRLAQYDDIGNREITRLADALTVELADVPAFDLSIGAPQVHEKAVECVGDPVPGWDLLVDGVRRAALSTFGGTMPDRPYGPHVTLAYATGPVSDAVVRARLDDAPSVGTLSVRTAHLMSVTMRPELGWFDFVELANWSLA